MARRLKPSLSAGSATAIALLACSPVATAAEWRVIPSLDLRETYTDNVRLAPAGAERSDFITDITPGINITASGPGLQLRARYGLQYLAYANDPTGSAIFHKLDAGANATLIKNLLFLDATAAMSQQSISPLGITPTDNFEVTANRTTVKTATLSPYFRRSFSGIAATELRYTHSTTATNTSALGTGHLDTLAFNVSSGPAFRTLGWGLSYLDTKSRLANTNTVNSSVTTGNLRYMITPQFFLTATGGYDKYDYVTIPGASSPNGPFYTGGFSWRPTERTSITASAGKRFFGHTYSLDSSVRSRTTVWHLSYNESVTTTPAQFALTQTNSTADLLDQLFRSSIPDDTRREQAIEQFILTAGLPSTLSRSVNFFTNQFFLQKTLQASVAINGARNTILFSATRAAREGQSLPDLTSPLAGLNSLAANSRQVGLSATWNWRITPLTTANATANFTKTQTGLIEAEQKLKAYRASLSRRFQPKLTGTIELRHVSLTSDAVANPVLGIPTNSYGENAVMAYLSMKF